MQHRRAGGAVELPGHAFEIVVNGALALVAHEPAAGSRVFFTPADDGTGNYRRIKLVNSAG